MSKPELSDDWNPFSPLTTEPETPSQQATAGTDRADEFEASLRRTYLPTEHRLQGIAVLLFLAAIGVAISGFNLTVSRWP